MRKDANYKKKEIFFQLKLEKKITETNGFYCVRFGVLFCVFKKNYI